MQRRLLFCFVSWICTVSPLRAYADECLARGSHYVSAFPLRQYCQDQRVTLGHSRHVQSYDHSYTTPNGNKVIPARIKTQDSFEKEVYEASTTTSFLDAYVSYVNGSIFDQQWSRIQFDVLYHPGTILSIYALDNIETSSNHYLVDGISTYVDCTDPKQVPQTMTGNAYVYVDETTGAPACACQLHYAYDHALGTCVPGCTTRYDGDRGWCGLSCQLFMGPNTQYPNYTFNTYTAYIEPRTCKAVCFPPNILVGGICTPYAHAYKSRMNSQSPTCYEKLMINGKTI